MAPLKNLIAILALSASTLAVPNVTSLPIEGCSNWPNAKTDHRYFFALSNCDDASLNGYSMHTQITNRTGYPTGRMIMVSPTLANSTSSPEAAFECEENSSAGPFTITTVLGDDEDLFKVYPGFRENPLQGTFSWGDYAIAEAQLFFHHIGGVILPGYFLGFHLTQDLTPTTWAVKPYRKGDIADPEVGEYYHFRLLFPDEKPLPEETECFVEIHKSY